MALSDCMKYKGFGLPLDEIKHITEENTPGYYSKILKKQIRNTKEELLKKQQLLDNLESYLKHLEFAKMNVGQYWYQAEPERKLYEVSRRNKGVFSDVDPDDSILKQWLEQINYLNVYVMISEDLILKADYGYKWCYGVEKHIIEMINLPEGERVITLLQGVYLHTTMYITDDFETNLNDLKQMKSELESRGLSLRGNIICKLLERDYINKNWYSLIELIIPVSK